MPQSQFTLRQGSSTELHFFPHIREFGLQKINTIQLDSFSLCRFENLHVYFIIDGKFEWSINKRHQVLFPGDTAVVLPGQEIGGSKGYLGIGSIMWLSIQVEKMDADGMILGKWSHLSESECRTIGKILLVNDLPVLRIDEMAGILRDMRVEIMNQEIGYMARINCMLDSLLIAVARQSTRQASSRRDFPQTFTKLEQELRKNLSHQWTVEEMAGMAGLGTTAFTEKVKSYSGFSPLNYLINIRISEAIKLLKQNKINITDIALEMGFYSSQHFSTTFKKLTGHTPGEFRKKNISSD